MAFASAKRTTAALVVTLSGAALAACGPQVHAHPRSADSASAASPSTTATGSAAASGTPSAGTSASGSVLSPSSADSSAPARQASPSASASNPAQSPSAQPGSPSASAPSGAPLVNTSIQHGTEDGGKSVALTFDDGPDPKWTPQVLALLQQHHAKATFCEIGPNAQRYPYLTKQITEAGFRLCDHSVHHDEQQSKKSLDYNTHEIVDAQREISAAAGPGAKLWYYRAPGGDFSPAIRNIAAEHGLRPLGWTVDSNDWQRPGVPAIMKTINQELKPGGIILMHDGGGDRSQSVAALAALLDQLDAQGYTYSYPGR
ncbi:polysaccharide deacetylase family protein [Streptomyces silvisoli]|uniref:Polysaccharide deacetylase family protein n=1 Tax=Streptomyces silvisoli TaxID=3034235 RepID=A0ABT5ZIA0_9ACTN|nr:polysaccharide deacetylase family protein [Streptomyces silvisoli]MDF3289559.1 polysaccharide deacetylase family protein [Streptomyces silvisoli]